MTLRESVASHGDHVTGGAARQRLGVSADLQFRHKTRNLETGALHSGRQALPFATPAWEQAGCSSVKPPRIPSERLGDTRSLWSLCLEASGHQASRMVNPSLASCTSGDTCLTAVL